MKNDLRNLASTLFLGVILAGTAFGQAYTLGAKVMHKGKAGMVTGYSNSGSNFLYKVRYNDGTLACPSAACVPESELSRAAAAPPPAPATLKVINKTPQNWLDAHNVHRRLVKSPDLKWSTDLANMATAYAQKMATNGPNNGCAYNHDLYGYKLDRGTYGENIGASLGPDPGVDKTADAIIQQFVDEKPNFDPASSRCKTGTVCGHYTQVISQLSTEVGCGQAVCASGGYTTLMYVCNYKGPGNIMTTKGYKDLYPGQR